MRLRTRLLAATAAAGLLAPPQRAAAPRRPAQAAATRTGSVTIYSADGLADWYHQEFKAFTRKTGIGVQYVEAGFG